MNFPVGILGIGSPFLDDQLGLRLVEEMQAEDFSPGIPGVEFRFMMLDRPGWGLLEILKTMDRAVLVDAMVSGGRPGSIRKLDPAEIPLPPHSLSSHEVGLSAVLGLGGILGILPRWMILYGVEIDPDRSALSTNKRPVPRHTADWLRHAIRREIQSHFEELDDLPEGEKNFSLPDDLSHKERACGGPPPTDN